MSIRTASFALIAGLTLAAPAAALADPKPVAAQVEKTAPAPAQQQDAAQYADREQTNKQVADYEGGQVIVYLSGAALVALILLLLLI